MAVIEVTSENFENEVLKSEVPVLVDFWASWCGPCKMLSPIVHEIAGEAEGFKVCSLNVDDAPDLAAAFQVSSIPTLMVFRGGEVVQRRVGFIQKPQILAMLSE